MTDKNSAKGFTLIETIIYVAIIGIVLTAFALFGFAIAAVSAKNHAAVEAQANARIIMSYLTDQIRASGGVVAPDKNSEGAVLELDMPDSSENLVLRVDDGVLFAYLGANEPFFISSSELEITELNFKNLAQAGEKDSIAIFLSLKYRYDSSLEYSGVFETQTAVSVKL